jgi:DNA-binding NtrC family response regulator
MTVKTLLVVDDENAMRRNVIDLLTGPTLRVIEAPDGETALTMLQAEDVDVVLLDLHMPGIDGIETLARIKAHWPELPVIMFTAYGTSERVIEAMKMGAYDYIEKPFDATDIQIVVNRAVDYAGLVTELSSLRHQAPERKGPNDGGITVIGHARCMQQVFKKVGQVSSSEAPVLIEGESGTGKELISDAIQRHSARARSVYVKVNCGALSESLLESEIFGHERGAFTGATNIRLGHFETANGGTLLLDEITSMSPRLQVQLLRVLQQGTFFRVGGEKSRQADVRLIALSNRHLEDEVEAGRFRADLFYRINVIRIILPPLRERMEDIPLLVRHFVEKYAPGRDIVVPDQVMARLLNHNWPGNVRELENAVQRGLALSHGKYVNIETGMTGSGDDATGMFYRSELQKGRSVKEILDDIESRIIRETLAEQGGNRSRTAEVLRVHRRYLYTKMKQYRIR